MRGYGAVNKPLLVLIVILTVIRPISSTSVARIYQDFSEILRRVSPELVEKFSDDDWNTIDPKFFSVLGCGNYSLRIKHIQNSAENTKVLAKHDDRIVNATLLDMAKGLVRDTETKRYFYVDSKSIEYDTMPVSRQYAVEIITDNPEHCKENGVLSYMLTTLKWKRHHELLAEQDDATLVTWATVTNSGFDPIYGDDVELIVGEHVAHVQRIQYRSYHSSGTGGSSSVGDQTDIDKINLHGMIIYFLRQKLSVGPKESVRFMLTSMHTDLKRFSVASNRLSSRNSEGRFVRVYEITPTEAIPDGSITVRQHSRIMGESMVSKPVNANEKLRVKLGHDNYVSYKRKVTAQHSDSNTTIYNVELHFLKSIDRVDVSIEYVEEVMTGTVQSVEHVCLPTAEQQVDFESIDFAGNASIPVSCNVSVSQVNSDRVLITHRLDHGSTGVNLTIVLLDHKRW